MKYYKWLHYVYGGEMRDQRPCAKLDNSLISRFSMAAALASLTLLLFACPNPGSPPTDPVLPGPVSTDLSVTATTPSNGATGFDPGQAIEVSFNKDLDPACLRQLQSPVTISPNTGPSITLTFSYDSAAKKLAIEPHPFLASNQPYTVSFETTLKDASGGTLPKQVDFSFRTGDNPAGDITLNGSNPYVTTNNPVTLSLQHNPSAAFVCIANSEAGLSNQVYTVSQAPATWPLTPGEGTQIVYVQFFNLDKSIKSTVRSASVVRDTQPPIIQSASVPAYYNMYNDASNPAFVASSSATDLTSGIATYSWNCAGVTYNAQSPAITISGPDGPYAVSLTVTDHAGNTAGPQNFTIWKDTVAPDLPTRSPVGYDLTSPSPALDYPYSMTWYWNASSTKPNPYQTPADTFLVMLNGKAQGSGLLSTTSFGPVIADHYDTYDLTVRQVDAAGNQSDALSIPIIVAPVIPPNGSTNVSQFTGLQWRDFSSNTATSWSVHLRDISDPNNDLGGPVGNMRQLLPNNPLGPGKTYNWYVEWSIDGHTYTPENRSPSDGTYYKFTVGQ